MRFSVLVCVLVGAGCGGSTSSGGDAGSVVTSDGGPNLTTDAGLSCNGLGTQKSRVACAANVLIASASGATLSTLNPPLTDFASRSKWNNLPVGMKPRAGVQMSALSAEQQTAVLELMAIALNANGRTTFDGILRADDYLATMASGYGSSTYSVAIFGTPGPSSDFEVMFGGHHMAFNLNFVGTSFAPIPQHLGCEPKAAFTINGGTYAPMTPKGEAIFAVYSALDATQKTEAYLAGQSFSDVVVNPNLDYGLGAGRT